MDTIDPCQGGLEAKMQFDQEALIRSIAVAGPRKYMLLCGAGTSASSGIPTAAQCVWKWKQEIYLSKNPHLDPSLFLDASLPTVQQKIQRWLDQQGGFPTRRAKNEYSFYIEYAYPKQEDRRRYFERLFAGSVPQAGYQLLAVLQNALIFQWTWTTNFDGLIRQARKPHHTIPLKDVGLDTSFRLGHVSNLDDCCLVVHLHGDYRYDPLSNTGPETQELDQELSTHLIKRVREQPLIVVGYGGSDESVMSALETAVAAKAAGGAIYWCVPFGREPSERVKKLMAAAKGQGFAAEIVEIDDFDDFMIRLARFQFRDRAQAREVEQLLAGSPAERSPLRLPDFEPELNWLKSNALALEVPRELYQCEVSGLAHWKDLRELIGDRPISAGLLRGKVLALGSEEEVQTAFAGRMTTKLELVPLQANDFTTPDSVVVGIFRQSLQHAIATHVGLRIKGKQALWDSAETGNERVGGVDYQVYRAVVIELTQNCGQLYVHLIPDLHVAASDGKEAPAEAVKEIKRRRLSKQWNDRYYNELEEWRKKIFGNAADLTLRYPPTGTHDFRFKLSSRACYAQLLRFGKPRSTAVTARAEVGFNAIVIREPSLVFGCARGRSRPTDPHPMRGLRNDGPYDMQLTSERLATEIRIGVVAPSAVGSRLNGYLRRLLQPHSSVETKAEYLLEYPGFQQAYRIPLSVPSLSEPSWCTLPPFDAAGSDVLATQRAVVSSVIREIERLQATSSVDVVVIFVPSTWKPFERIERDNVRYDLHDFIKAYCAQHGIRTQFLREETMAKGHQCEVLWWLAQSLYVKSLRTPFVLDTSDNETVFVGIGYSPSAGGPGGPVVMGCSHIYDAAGQGLRFRLSRITNAVWRQKNPYLTRDDAIRVGLQTRQLFYDTYHKLPRRVVLHKRTPFMRDEREGLAQSFKGVDEIEMLTIEQDHAWRFLAYNTRKKQVDGFPVARGTAILLNSYQFLLWVHGGTKAVNERGLTYYQGKSRIPVPMRVTRCAGHSTLEQLAFEIVGLSKMDWNSYDLYSQMPATLESSRAIARVGQLLSRLGPETYDYRLFI